MGYQTYMVNDESRIEEIMVIGRPMYDDSKGVKVNPLLKNLPNNSNHQNQATAFLPQTITLTADSQQQGKGNQQQQYMNAWSGLLRNAQTVPNMMNNSVRWASQRVQFISEWMFRPRLHYLKRLSISWVLGHWRSHPYPMELRALNRRLPLQRRFLASWMKWFKDSNSNNSSRCIPMVSTTWPMNYSLALTQIASRVKKYAFAHAHLPGLSVFPGNSRCTARSRDIKNEFRNQ